MLITDDFLRFLDAVIETTARRLKAFIGEPFIETPVFSQSVAVIAWVTVNRDIDASWKRDTSPFWVVASLSM